MTTAAKNAHTSSLIMAGLDRGDSLETAIEVVLGKGTYAKLVDELYTELRAKAARA
jgi:hypothetical protein